MLRLASPTSSLESVPKACQQRRFDAPPSRPQLRDSGHGRATRLHASLIALGLVACSSSGSGLAPRTQSGGEDATSLDFTGGSNAGGIIAPTPPLPLDSNALLSVDPPSGPFVGGQVAVLRGSGFSSEARVWFGDAEVPSELVVANRADRIQVTVPAGVPGLVSVSTQNAEDAETRRSLTEGYRYEGFFAEPASGPTSGGSTLTLVGLGNDWDDETRVTVDLAECPVTEVRDTGGGGQELDCVVPAGTAGEKSISVSTPVGTDTVIGAFRYEPGVALSGGLSGEALGDRLVVNVRSRSGVPIPGAFVILGETFDPARLDLDGEESLARRTDETGLARFELDFADSAMVTIAARCFQPLTLAGVSVDTVTAELAPRLTADCVDPPTPVFGGAPSEPVTVRGELVWAGAVEFQRADWTNVPNPQNPAERRAAYVFQLSGNATGTFRLPNSDDAITDDAPGLFGYEFELTTGSGTRDYYAIAGIENRERIPARFSAYALGLVRGVQADPGETIEDLAVAMNSTLDQPLSFDLLGPTLTSRGPDRVDLRTSIEVAPGRYALLPNTRVDVPLPAAGPAAVVGLPALSGALSGARYVVGASAVSGSGGGSPSSILPLLYASDTSARMPVRRFVPVPTLDVGPNADVRWTRELGVDYDRGQTPAEPPDLDAPRPVDLVHYSVIGSSGLVTWTVVSPPSTTGLRLPDLSLLPSGGIPSGPLQIVVRLASVPELEYESLRSSELQPTAWDGFAVDAATARHDP